MNIVLNGEGRDIEPDVTIMHLLEQLDLSQVRLAVEVNEAVVPRSRFAEHRLNDGDEVEIVRAIGGG